jgi:endonuclease-3
LKWVNTEKPEVTRAELEKLLPKDEWKPINVNLVGFGQKICAPTHPKCEKCSLSQVEGLCPYFTEIYPQKKNKKKK